MPQNDEVEPAATPVSSRDRPKFLRGFSDPVAGFVEQFGWEGARADASRVGLADPYHGVDRSWANPGAQAGASADEPCRSARSACSALVRSNSSRKPFGSITMPLPRTATARGWSRAAGINWNLKVLPPVMTVWPALLPPA